GRSRKEGSAEEGSGYQETGRAQKGRRTRRPGEAAKAAGLARSDRRAPAQRSRTAAGKARTRAQDEGPRPGKSPRAQGLVMRLSHIGSSGCAGLVLCLPAGQAIADDAPEIAVEASASEIFVGESIDYVVEIRNVKNPARPDLGALRQDFDVTPNGDESRNQSSTFIINGRVTQQSSFGHVFRFRLTP